jgi:hypothetical protein
MIVKCIRSLGSELGENVRGHFYSDSTVFDVKVDGSYLALGMGIFETVLLLLIHDETGQPNWLPIGLFEIQWPLLPADWHFVVRDGRAASGGDATNRWVAVWGYPDLVNDPRHGDGLIERDPDALKIFFRELAKVQGK